MAYDNPQLKRLEETLINNPNKAGMFGSNMADLLHQNATPNEEISRSVKSGFNGLFKYFETSINIQNEQVNILRQIANLLAQNSSTKNKQSLVSSAAKQGIEFDTTNEETKTGRLSFFTNMWRVNAKQSIEKQLKKSNRKLARSMGISMSLSSALTTPASVKFRGIVAENEVDFTIVNTNILLGIYELQRLSLQQLTDISKGSGGSGNSTNSSIQHRLVAKDRIESSNYEEDYSDQNPDPRTFMDKLGDVPFIGQNLKVLMSPIKELLTLPSLPERIKLKWNAFKDSSGLQQRDATAALKGTNMYRSTEQKAFDFLGGEFITTIERMRADLAAIRSALTGEPVGVDYKTGKSLTQSREDLYDEVLGKYFEAQRDSKGRITKSAEDTRSIAKGDRENKLRQWLDANVSGTGDPTTMIASFVANAIPKKYRDKLGIQNQEDMISQSMGAIKNTRQADYMASESDRQMEVLEQSIKNMDFMSTAVGGLVPVLAMAGSAYLGVTPAAWLTSLGLNGTLAATGALSGTAVMAARTGIRNLSFRGKGKKGSGIDEELASLYKGNGYSKFETKSKQEIDDLIELAKNGDKEAFDELRKYEQASRIEDKRKNKESLQQYSLNSPKIHVIIDGVSSRFINEIVNKIFSINNQPVFATIIDSFKSISNSLSYLNPISGALTQLASFTKGYWDTQRKENEWVLAEDARVTEPVYLEYPKGRQNQFNNTPLNNQSPSNNTSVNNQYPALPNSSYQFKICDSGGPANVNKLVGEKFKPEATLNETTGELKIVDSPKYILAGATTSVTGSAATSKIFNNLTVSLEKLNNTLSNQTAVLNKMSFGALPAANDTSIAGQIHQEEIIKKEKESIERDKEQLSTLHAIEQVLEEQSKNNKADHVDAKKSRFDLGKFLLKAAPFIAAILPFLNSFKKAAKEAEEKGFDGLLKDYLEKLKQSTVGQIATSAQNILWTIGKNLLKLRLGKYAIDKLFDKEKSIFRNKIEKESPTPKEKETKKSLFERAKEKFSKNKETEIKNISQMSEEEKLRRLGESSDTKKVTKKSLFQRAKEKLFSSKPKVGESEVNNINQIPEKENLQKPTTKKSLFQRAKEKLFPSKTKTPVSQLSETEKLQLLSSNQKSPSGFGDKLKGIGSTVKSELTGFGKDVRSKWAGMRQIINHPFQSIGKGANAIAEGVSSLNTSISDKIANVGSKIAGGASKAAGFLGKAAGKLATPLAVFQGAHQMYSDFKETGDLGKAVFGVSKGGGMAGAAEGASKYGLIGMGLGSVLPGVGNMVGGAIGSLVGGVMGYFGADKVKSALDSIGETINDWNYKISDMFYNVGDNAGSFSEKFTDSKVPFIMPILAGSFGAIVDGISFLVSSGAGLFKKLPSMMKGFDYNIQEFFTGEYSHRGAELGSIIPITGTLIGGLIGVAIDGISWIFKDEKDGGGGGVAKSTDKIVDMVDNQIINLFSFGKYAKMGAEVGRDTLPIAGSLLGGLIGSTADAASFLFGEKALNSLKDISLTDIDKGIVSVFKSYDPLAGEWSAYGLGGIPLLSTIVYGLMGVLGAFFKNFIDDEFFAKAERLWYTAKSKFWSLVGFDDNAKENQVEIDKLDKRIAEIQADKKKQFEARKAQEEALAKAKAEEENNAKKEREAAREKREKARHGINNPPVMPTQPGGSQAGDNKAPEDSPKTGIADDAKNIINDAKDKLESETNKAVNYVTNNAPDFMKDASDVVTQFGQTVLSGTEWLGKSIFTGFKTMSGMFLSMVDKLSGWFKEHAPDYYKNNIEPMLATAKEDFNKIDFEGTARTVSNVTNDALKSAQQGIQYTKDKAAELAPKVSEGVSNAVSKGKDIYDNTIAPAVSSGYNSVKQAISSGSEEIPNGKPYDPITRAEKNKKLWGSDKLSADPKFLSYLDSLEDSIKAPRGVLEGIMIQESGGGVAGKPGDHGASVGAFQFQKATAIDMGLDPNDRSDPYKSATAAAKMLKIAYDRYHDWKLAIISHNLPAKANALYKGIPYKQKSGDPDYLEHVLSHMPDKGKIIGNPNIKPPPAQTTGSNNPPQPAASTTPTNNQPQNNTTAQPSAGQQVKNAAKTAYDKTKSVFSGGIKELFKFLGEVEADANARLAAKKQGPVQKLFGGQLSKIVLDDDKDEVSPDSNEMGPKTSTNTKNEILQETTKVSGDKLNGFDTGYSNDIPNVKKLQESVKLNKLHPEVYNRLTGMAKEYKEITGKDIRVGSAYRTEAEQASSISHARKGYAAKQGKSMHQWGYAIDLETSSGGKQSKLGDELASLHLLEKYGFSRPMMRPDLWEPWHIEPVEIDGPRGTDGPRLKIPDGLVPQLAKYGPYINQETKSESKSEPVTTPTPPPKTEPNKQQTAESTPITTSSPPKVEPPPAIDNKIPKSSAPAVANEAEFDYTSENEELELTAEDPNKVPKSSAPEIQKEVESQQENSAEFQSQLNTAFNSKPQLPSVFDTAIKTPESLQSSAPKINNEIKKTSKKVKPIMKSVSQEIDRSSQIPILEKKISEMEVVAKEVSSKFGRETNNWITDPELMSAIHNAGLQFAVTGDENGLKFLDPAANKIANDFKSKKYPQINKLEKQDKDIKAKLKKLYDELNDIKKNPKKIISKKVVDKEATAKAQVELDKTIQDTIKTKETKIYSDYDSNAKPKTDEELKALAQNASPTGTQSSAPAVQNAIDPTAQEMRGNAADQEEMNKYNAEYNQWQRKLNNGEITQDEFITQRDLLDKKYPNRSDQVIITRPKSENSPGFQSQLDNAFNINNPNKLDVNFKASNDSKIPQSSAPIVNSLAKVDYSDMSKGHWEVPIGHGVVFTMTKEEYEKRKTDPNFTTDENPYTTTTEQLKAAKWYDTSAVSRKDQSPDDYNRYLQIAKGANIPRGVDAPIKSSLPTSKSPSNLSTSDQAAKNTQSGPYNFFRNMFKNKEERAEDYRNELNRLEKEKMMAKGELNPNGSLKMVPVTAQSSAPAVQQVANDASIGKTTEESAIPSSLIDKIKAQNNEIDAAAAKFKSSQSELFAKGAEVKKQYQAGKLTREEAESKMAELKKQSDSNISEAESNQAKWAQESSSWTGTQSSAPAVQQVANDASIGKTNSVDWKSNAGFKAPEVNTASLKEPQLRDNSIFAKPENSFESMKDEDTSKSESSQSSNQQAANASQNIISSPTINNNKQIVTGGENGQVPKYDSEIDDIVSKLFAAIPEAFKKDMYLFGTGVAI